MSADNEDAEAAAQRAWELEMEMAIDGRGRSRSRSILGDRPDDPSEDLSNETPPPMNHSPMPTPKRRTSSSSSSDSASKYTSGVLERGIDVVDGGHTPISWSARSASNRTRAKSFSAQTYMQRCYSEDDNDNTSQDGSSNGDSEVDFDHMPPVTSRRRSCSFSSMELGDSEGNNDDVDQIVKRAASLSKIYLVGSAPVDVSKLQDDSKIVGVKKVEVAQPTGALSAKALDALSEGLQLSLIDNSVAGVVATTGDEKRVLTEEELEEKMMEEEEDQKLKVEKLSTRKSLSARASFFKSRVFKSKNRSAAAGASAPPVPSSGSTATSAIERSLTDSGTESPAPQVKKHRHKLKLLLLGDSGVGKTSLMRVFSGDSFSESMLATAGVDFKLRHISIEDEDIALQIWDTAGQERFHRITATYYKGANGIVLVYDVSDKRGFDNVGYWMNNIRQFSGPNIPAMLLVGNKIDLPTRAVSSEDGQAAANQYHCRFIETSAKTSENTNGALETIARDAFFMSLNPTMTQKMLIEKEKSFIGRKSKENCVIS